MDINVEVSGADNERVSMVDETVEVIDTGGNGLAPDVENTAQQLIVAHPQEVLIPSTEVQIETQSLDHVTMATINSSQMIAVPVDSDATHQATIERVLGNKRPSSHAELTFSTEDLLQATSSPIIGTSLSPSDIPRKKSRNYLDSHKTIEKKRRDRINTCLDSLKTLVPDCRQYGSKKLDKAEILEMTIEYLQSVQNQGAGRGAGNMDMSMGQREWANDLTTWVIHNKLLYNGSNSLDQFCQSLLLHLQSMGSGNALASATSMLLNQGNSTTDEDALLRQQTVSAQAVILQHLQQQVSPNKEGGGNSPQHQLQQAQLTQLQALLLLQQQQQLLNQQQQQESDAQSQQAHLQQLQQLQQLQALLLQHIANETTTTPLIPAAPSRKTGEDQDTSTVSTPTSANPSVELARADDLSGPVSTEETVYTSALADSLGENLLQVNVSVSSQAPGRTAVHNATGDMWSSGATQPGSLVMLSGGASETERVGVEVAEESNKSQLTVQEEVELLVQQEQ